MSPGMEARRRCGGGQAGDRDKYYHHRPRDGTMSPQRGSAPFGCFAGAWFVGGGVKLTMSPQRGHMRVLKGNSSGAEGEMVPPIGRVPDSRGGSLDHVPPAGLEYMCLASSTNLDPQRGSNGKQFVVQSSLCNLYCAISANKKSTDPKYKECKRNI